MRGIVKLTLLLGFIGLLAYFVDWPAKTDALSGPVTQWRHTADGWEKVSALWGTEHATIANVWSVQPHPLVLSLFIGLFSTLLLVAFSPAKAASPRKPKRLSLKLKEVPLKSCAWADDTRLR